MLFTACILISLNSCKEKKDSSKSITQEIESATYTETYRPQFHFSPPRYWMNDPNGMVYHKGIYHLFYQFYPEDIKWGPMHWGHAISKDLMHWEHKPIALYPDKNGYIFSGSVVLDIGNTSGLGSIEDPPLVAIFTYHDPEGEKSGEKDFQTQGIAYSLDNGDTWTPYKENPVIENVGVKDFRDPKVFWDDHNQAWVMSLVAGDHLQLWGSNNLKSWTKLSEFGKKRGAHGGVWECPDLFKLKVEGTDEEKWVLLISINPGAPNGGSGTQYFVGDFDGERFTTDQTAVKWIDWGTDNYAGVTYHTLPQNYYGDTYDNNPGQDRIFIGWMSNWAYAQETPTKMWRSAMTIPRKLSLYKEDDTYILYSYPVASFDSLRVETTAKEFQIVGNGSERIASENLNQAEIRFTTASKDFALTFMNDKGEETVLTMNSDQRLFLLDRIVSGVTDFDESFANKIQQMPITNLPEDAYEVRILIDRSSIEVFINKGQYVMTAQLFPTKPYTSLEFENASAIPITIENLNINPLKRIW